MVGQVTWLGTIGITRLLPILNNLHVSVFGSHCIQIIFPHASCFTLTVSLLTKHERIWVSSMHILVMRTYWSEICRCTFLKIESTHMLYNNISKYKHLIPTSCYFLAIWLCSGRQNIPSYHRTQGPKQGLAFMHIFEDLKICMLISTYIYKKICSCLLLSQ